MSSNNTSLTHTPPQIAIHLSQKINDMMMIAPSRIIEEDQNYEVKMLHDDDNEACVDIVFVHELINNAYNI